jgi:hypothetical protein
LAQQVMRSSAGMPALSHHDRATTGTQLALVKTPQPAPIPHHPKNGVHAVSGREERVIHGVRYSVLKGNHSVFRIAQVQAVPTARPDGHKRYDKFTRSRIDDKIIEGHDKGSTPVEITRSLNAGGFRSPSGAPLTVDQVTQRMYTLADQGRIVVDTHRRRRSFQPQTPVPTAPTPEPTSVQQPQRLPAACIAILTDPQLTDAQRVKMCLAYADVD